MDKPIYVTSPLLPPLEDFTSYLKEIWDSRILTNNGSFHKKLEEELAIFKSPLSLFIYQWNFTFNHCSTSNANYR